MVSFKLASKCSLPVLNLFIEKETGKSPNNPESQKHSVGLKKSCRFFLTVLSSIVLLLIASGLDTQAQAQEKTLAACSDGIDNDGDSLVDINDPDCGCLATFTPLPPSLVTNPSFEEQNCCPTSITQLFCADSWEQATRGTSDYFHTCGFIKGTGGIATDIPQPFPDGDGAGGAIFRPNPEYTEYLGTCPTSPLEANVSYTFKFFAGAPSGPGSFGGNTSGDLVLLGIPACPSWPIAGIDNKEDNFDVIATVNVSLTGGGPYILTQMVFTPTQEYAAVMLGSGKNMTIESGRSGNYVLFDALILNETDLFGADIIVSSGDVCTRDLVLATPTLTSEGPFNFQWYEGGAAIPGANFSTYSVPAGPAGEGDYILRIDDGTDCEITRLYTVDISPCDTDNDGIADVTDIDDDNDGITDLVEGNNDLDNDNIPNSLDDDSDGDGITDSNEGHDGNGDGQPDVVATGFDDDNDGLDNAFDPNQNGTPATLPDSDNDGDKNFVDTDDDNDSILTVDEDTNGDDNPLNDDDDNDGIPDFLDPDPVLDSDNDGIADVIDIDDDNDGITDLVEGNDDLDNDDIPNSLDDDSDGDGVPDANEGHDGNGDGQPDVVATGFDDDDDGLDNAFDPDQGGTPATLPDSDSDGDNNFVDTDDDNDGILTADEDTNGDGNPLNDDDDNDGIPDFLDPDPVNTPPIISQLSDTTATEDELFEAQITASDINSDNLTFSVPIKPDWLIFESVNDTTLKLTGTPAMSDVGIHDVVVKVEDGNGGTDSTSFTVTVLNSNDAPIISQISDTTAIEDELFEIQIAASDIDGDTLTFSVPIAPAWLTFELIDDRTLKLTGTPEMSDVGVHPVTVKVEDANDGTALTFFVVTVLNSNDTPIISQLSDTTATEDELFEIQVTGSDIDGDTLTFSVPIAPAWLIFESVDDTTLKLTGTPVMSDVGVHAVIVKVSDGNGGSDTTSFTVTVLNSNDAPIISQLSDTTAIEDELFEIEVTASDIDGDTLTFSVPIAPAWLVFELIDDRTLKLTGIPEMSDVGIHPVTVKVEDGNGSAALTFFVITVLNSNDAPIISQLSDTTAIKDELFEAQITASDIDDDNLTFSVPMKPDWLIFESINDTTLKLTGTPAMSDVGIHDVTVKITDGNGAADSTSFVITVLNSNDAPGLFSLFLPSNGDTIFTVLPEFQWTKSQDIDGDSVSYSLVINDSVFALGIDTTSFTLGTTLEHGQDYSWYVIANDGKGGVTPSDTFSFRIDSDSDNDGITDVVDVDDDNDGITDLAEGDGDLDNDDIPNSLDDDSDGDGIPDANEGHDGNGDGQPDVVATGFDNDDDGLDNAFDPDQGGTPATLPDTDSDGDKNLVDTDDDNDGTLTADEDTNGDGNPLNDDDDNDGIPDFLDPDPVIDSDNDGLADVIDIDDDNDGITDLAEGDGDLDNDGIPNSLDDDSDGDGIPDANEGHDGNGDGQPDVVATGFDDDDDGLDNAFDPDQGGTPATLPDTDSDGDKNFVDTDDDNDGTLTADEDTNGDGNPLNDDDDNDGIPDFLDPDPVNTPPMISQLSDTTATEDELFEVQITASDIDSDNLTFSVPIKPDWLNFESVNDTTLELTGTPAMSDVGIHDVIVKIADGNGGADSTSFTITVLNSNDAPIISQLSDTTATEDELFEVEVTASDIDGDNLNFSVPIKPGWLTFDSVDDTTLRLTGTPAMSDVGVHDVTVKVADGNGSTDSTSFTITVLNSNDAPIITQLSDTTATEDELFEVEVTASDIDGDTLTFSVPIKPAWLIFESINDTTLRLTGTPAMSDVGVHNVTVKVADGNGGSDSTAFVLTVLNSNDAPIITQLSDTTATEDELFEVEVTASDIDGDTLTFSVPIKPAWLIFESINDTTLRLTGTPAMSDVGIHDVIVKVADGNGGSDSTSFVVTVLNSNDAPIISQLSDTTATEDELFEVEVMASDIDGDNLTFSVPIKPAWLTFEPVDDTTLKLTGTPAMSDVGIHDVIVKVADGNGGSDSTSFVVTVLNSNDAPIISQLSDTTATEDELFEIQVTGSDIDGDNLIFSVPIKPGWLTFDSVDDTTLRLSGTPAMSDVGIHDVIVKVVDGNGSTDTTSFTITVLNSNDAPVISQLSDITAIEDELFEIQVTGSDIDGDTLTFSVPIKPDWLTFESVNDTTLKLTGTPAMSDVGIHDVIVKVVDGNGSTDTTSFTITVLNSNDAPIISQLSDTTATEDELFEIQVTASDIDADTLTFSVPIKPDWLIFESVDDTTLELTGTPAMSDVGIHDVRVKIADGNGGADSTSFTITVLNSNDAPIISQLSDTTATEDELFELQVTASDIDGDNLSFSVPIKPDWLNFESVDDTTLRLTGIPAMSDVGIHDVTVKVADDNGGADSTLFTITVLNSNDVPIISQLSDTTATEDELFEVEVMASDIDGDNLTFSVPIKPAWLTFESINDTTLRLTGTPAMSDVGVHNVTVKVADGNGGSDSTAFVLTVLNSNDAPVISQLSDTTAIEDELFEIQVTGSDIDGDNLTFSVPIKPAWLTFESINDTTLRLTGTPAMSDVGVHNVTVKVAGGNGGSDSTSFVVTVLNSNDAPIISQLSDTTATEDELFEIQVTGSDIDGDNLSFSVPIKPAWLIFESVNDTTVELTGTPAMSDVGIHNVTVKVADGNGGSDSTSFVVTVLNSNDAPIISQLSDTTATEDELFEVQVTASDIDGDNLAFSVPVKPDWLNFESINDTTLKLTGTPAMSDVGVHNVTVKVADGNGGSDSTSFVVTVLNSNDAPIISQLSDTMATEDELFEVQVTASDIDGDNLAFSVPVKPGWLNFESINDTTLKLTGTPAMSDVGGHNVTVKVADGNGGSDSTSFVVTVLNSNDAPIISQLSDTMATEDELFEVQVTAYDIDGDNLAFSVPVKPDWLNFESINDTTLKLTGTPAMSDVGVHNVTVKVADGNGGSDSTSFVVTVLNSNDAPIISQLSDTTATEDELFEVQVTASDIDGDNLAFSVPVKPDWLNFESINDTTLKLTGTPAMSDVGIHDVTVKITDGNGSADTTSFTITVLNSNDAPIISQLSDTTATEDELFEVEVTASDIDGDTLTFNVPIKSDWLTFESVNDTTLKLTGTPAMSDVGGHNVTVKVADGNGGSDSTSFVVTVLNSNDAPIISQLSDTTATEDELFEVQVTASDIDGDNLAFSVPVKPDWLNFESINDTTLKLTGTPAMSDVGIHDVTVKITDGNGSADTTSFTITVLNSNDAPIISQLSDTTATEDELFEVEVTASDIDGDTLTFNVPIKSDWLTFESVNDTTLKLTGTPAMSDVGVHNVTVKVADGNGGSDSTSFVVTVLNSNDAPIISQLSDTTATEDELFEIQVTGSDIDGDNLSFSVPIKPAWLIFESVNDTTVELTGTPAMSDVGIHNVTVKVADGNGGSDSTSFVVTVLNSNDAPIISQLSDTMATEDELFEVQVTASDIDGDNLAFSVPVKPGWLNFESINDTTLKLTGTPAMSDVGVHNVTVKVADGNGGSDSTSFVVTVLNSNDAPIISQLSDTTATEDELFEIQVTGSDIDGDNLSFSVPIKPAWLIFESVNDTTVELTGTPAMSDVGIHNVTVKVADGNGGSDSTSFVVTVLNSNDAPIISQLSDTMATEDELFEVQVTASDIDGDNLAFSVPVKPGWLNFESINDTTLKLTGTPAMSDVGIHDVTVKITDGNGSADSISFTITVLNSNDAPIISQLSDTTATEDELFEVEVTASDIDGDTLTFNVPIKSDWLTFESVNDTTLKLTGTPAMSDVGVHNVTVKVADGNGGSDSTSFVVTVLNSNDAPIISQLSDTTATEDELFEVQVTASDIDGDNLAFSVPVKPDWLNFESINDTTLKLTGTPAMSDVGIHDVTVKITDGNGSADTTSFTITVLNSNDAPIISQLSDTTATEDELFEVQVTASDIDGDNLAFSVPVKPGWLNFESINDTTLKLTGTPAMSDVGVHNVTVKVADGNGGSDSTSFVVTVLNSNDAPIISQLSYTTATEDELFEVQVTASDIDGDNLAFSVPVKPDWLNFESINDTTLKLTGTPAMSDVGIHDVTVKVADGNGGADSTLFVITVLNSNDAPIISQLSDTTAIKDELFEAQITASDIDDDNLTFSVPMKPDWLIFESVDDTTLKLTGTPAMSDVGIHDVTVKITDGNGAVDSTSFVITVLNSNDAPGLFSLFLPSNGDTIFTVLPEFQWTKSQDIDGDSVSYSLVINDFVFALGIDTTSFTLGTTLEHGQDYSWYVIANDGKGGVTPSDTFSFRIDSDSDNDGITDVVDVDDDNDGIPDLVEGDGDIDNDDIPNSLDDDSDGDGIPDANEGHDGNGDGQPDVVATGFDNDDDGLDNAFDPDQGGTPATLPDTDSDGDNNFVDTDDDNDGTLTVDEDTNGDGNPLNDDDDNDGIPDFLDPDPVIDSDNDGLADVIDIDDDNDGITDLAEGDGDFDNDGIPNSLDDDSDGDGVPDANEGHDGNGDGQPDVVATGFDNDDDGLDNVFDPDQGGTPATLPDTDSDGDKNLVDTDDDNDGTLTADEDTNGDGNPLNDDDDNDGIPDFLDPDPVNTPPMISQLSDTTATEDELFEIQVTGSDIDDDNLTFSVPIKPDWLTFESVDDTTLKLTGTPGMSDVGIHDVIVKIADGNGGADSTSFTITVLNSNDAPIISQLSDTTATEDELFEVEVTASDIDGDTLTFSVPIKPAWLIFESVNDTTLKLTGTPAMSDVGIHDVIVKVADGNGGSDSTSFVVTVLNSNDAPIISQLSDTTATEDELFEVKVTASDIDGDNLTFSVPIKPAWLIFESVNDTTLKLTGTPAMSDVGIHDVIVKVADGNGGADSTSFTVTVLNSNDAPVISQLSDITATEDELFEIQVRASDIDADTLTFSVPIKPDWLIFESVNDTTLKLTGTPAMSDVGIHDVIVKVADGNGGADSTSFTVTVLNSNDAPIISQLSDTTATEDELFEVKVTASDIDGDNLTFSVPIKPAWLIFESVDDTTLKLTGTPVMSDVGIHDVIVKVADSNGGADSTSFTVTVLNSNDAPIISQLSDTTAIEDELFEIQVTASDIDGDTLTFNVPIKPDWLIFESVDDTTLELTGTPAMSDVGVHNVAVRVTDGNGSADSTSFMITVLNSNDAPVISQLSDTTAIEDELFEIQVTASDIDGDNLSFSVPIKPDWLTFESVNDTILKLTGTPAMSDVGIHDVTIKVADGNGGADTTLFTVTVLNSNDAPIISQLSNTTVTEDELFEVEVTASDIDGDTLTFSVPIKPDWLIFESVDDTTLRLTGIPAMSDVGIHDVTVKVADGNGGADTTSFVVTVLNSNDTPVISQLSDTTVIEDELFEIQVTASDIDGDTLNFSVSIKPAWLIFESVDDTTLKLTGTPVMSDVGIHDVIVKVADSNGGADSTSFTVTVLNSNDAPIISQLSDTTAIEDELFEIQVTASDIDGDTLTFNVPIKPDWLIFESVDDTTLELTGTPAMSDVGVHNVAVRVTDGNGSADSTSFMITVLNSNDAPVISQLSDTTAIKDELFEAQITASDIDDDNLSFSVPIKPDWLTFESVNDTTLKLTGTPAMSDVGIHDVTIKVADGNGGADSTSFTITVLNSNDAPIISQLSNTTVTEDELFEVEVTASDIDGDTLTFSVPIKPDWLIFESVDDTTLRLTGIPAMSDVGIHDVTVKVADGNGGADTTLFTITVLNSNDVPVISQLFDTTATEDELFEVEVTASDIDGDNLNFSVPIKPDWLNFESVDDTTLRLTGIPAMSDVGIHNVTVKVADGNGGADSTAFTITVLSSPFVCEAMITSPEDSSFVCVDEITLTVTTLVTGGIAPIQRVCIVNGDTITTSGNTFDKLVDLQSGYNTIVTTCIFTDSKDNTSTCRDTVVVFFDTTPSTCTLNFDNLPVITGEAIDQESGIAKIEIVEINNRIVTIAPFEEGDNVVAFSSDVIDIKKRSSFTLKITNTAGCVEFCDPVFLQLSHANSPCHFTFSLPQTDRYLYVENMGLTQISLDINGHNIALMANENGRGDDGNIYSMPFEGKRSIDLLEYLVEGKNVFDLRCEGPANTYANLLISDIDVDDGSGGKNELPITFTLGQNYPNPFNPETRISFEVPAQWNAPVTLKVINIQGQIIATLVDGFIAPGNRSIVWNGRDKSGQRVASGVYFYQVVSGKFVKAKKMLLAK